MGKYFLAAVFCLGIFTAQGQEHNNPADSLTAEKKWDVSLDILSRYIWRGQSWGSNTIAVQPAFNYAISQKWTVGVWATTNFETHSFENDGTTPSGYQEFDLGFTYRANGFLSVSVWDYYWPAYRSFEDEDQDYFNYGPNSVKTIDLSVVLDFSEGYKYPFTFTVSTLVAGNDYRYNAGGKNPEQNFTTYAEVEYAFENVFGSGILRNININPTVGAVLNNAAAYYTYGDYDRISFINLNLNAMREFNLGHGILMPLRLDYTHNAASKNTGPFGKDFVTAGISFCY